MSNQADANNDTSDATDGREPYDYKSKYPAEALTEIKYEGIYLLFILLFSLFMLFASWAEILPPVRNFTPAQVVTMKKYAYYAFAGMLGGITFGIKYFYRVVARGSWHQDRRVWRLMSPFIATVVAFITGALVESNMAYENHHFIGGATAVSIGFMAGYFADEAVGKMYEIATVVFGKSATQKKE